MNRVKGALYGVAVGDALGAPLEFMNASEIKATHGTVRDMIGGGWLNVLPGEVTDDTQMTLAVAEGIARSPEAPIEAIGNRFISWMLSRPKDIGNTCYYSIDNAMKASRFGLPSAQNWFDAAHKTHISGGGKSAGNGSLMRTVYVGLFYDEYTNALDYAKQVSDMTHFDPLASLSCKLYTAMVYKMIRTESLNARKNIIRELCESSTIYRNIFSPDYTPIPSGYVVDSFAAALHSIHTSSTFEDTIVKAVNLGGDADTIGAITGGLAGALYGFDAIPTAWVQSLQIRDQLDRLSKIAVSH